MAVLNVDIEGWASKYMEGCLCFILRRAYYQDDWNTSDEPQCNIKLGTSAAFSTSCFTLIPFV